MTRRILVTGANGFVGRALCEHLYQRGIRLIRICRKRKASDDDSIEIGDIAVFNDWERLLRGVDVVVHLAGRAHVTNDKSDRPLSEFRKVNVIPTRQIAEAAKKTSVSRIVYVSSIGVSGNSTSVRPIDETCESNPSEDYARSKWEAEQALQKIAAQNGLEFTIVRPTLVYGPGAKGNFERLMRLVGTGMPIPLGAVRNRRSFLGVRNLCALLDRCTWHPKAAHRLFVAADGEDVSTPQLLMMIAENMHKKLYLPKIPLPIVRAFATVAGRSREIDQLSQSLQVNAMLAREKLGWMPQTSLADGLKEMVDWHLRN